MNVLHFADLHLDDSTTPNSERAMEQILEAAKRERPDLIINAGDLSMRRGHLAPWVALRLRQFHDALAEIAPTIVVEGNHDLTYEEGRAGTLSGALRESGAAPGRLFVVERPEVVRIPGLPDVACLPYPSKFRLLAASGGRVGSTNEEVQSALVEIVRGLAAASGPGALLVFHGTVDGAKAGSESIMATEIDALLRPADIPHSFRRVLCGHIHRHQTIPCADGLPLATYCGSPAPLSFSEENYAHGYILWSFPADPALIEAETFVELEPAERLLTVDVRAAGIPRDPGDPAMLHGPEDPKSGIIFGAGAFEVDPREHAFIEKCPAAARIGGLANVNVRLLATVGRNEDGARVRDRLERIAREAGATKVRVVLERLSDDLTVPLSQAVKMEGDLEKLLDLWAARVPEVAANLAALKAKAHELETLVPFEAHSSTNAAEYRLVSLDVANWKSFRAERTRVDLSACGSLVAVEGENASGKSNLMEAEAFALWGRTLRGRQTLSELVRKGTDRANVTAIFDSDGERWKVSRSIRIRKGGVGVAELSLARWCADLDQFPNLRDGAASDTSGKFPWAPMDKGTATETQAFLELLVGPLDLYLATRYASQGDVDRLLSMAPAELKTLLQRALNVGAFEAREDVGRTKLAEADLLVTRLHGRASGLRDIAGDPEAIRAEVAGVESTVELVRIGLESCKRTHAALAEAQNAATAEQVRLEGIATQRRAVDLRVRGADARSSDLRLRAAGERRRAATERADTGTAAEIERLRAGLESYDATVKMRDEARTDASKRNADCNEIRHRLAEQTSALDRAHSEANARLALARAQEGSETRLGEAKIAKLRADVESVRKLAGARVEAAGNSASLLLRVPFGEKCADAGCSFVAEAVKARDTLPALEADMAGKVVEVETRLAEGEAAHAAALLEASEKVRAALDATLPSAFETQQRDLDACALATREMIEWARSTATVLLDLEDRVAAMDTLQSALKTQEASLATREDRAREFDASAVAFTERADEAQAEAERATAELAALPVPDLAAAAEAVRVTAEARGTEAANEATAQKDYNLLSERLAQMRARLEQAEKVAVEITRTVAEHHAAVREVELLALYVRAVGRDGLPFLVLERAVPALEARANHFLGEGSDLRVAIESARDLQSGEQRADVVVRYTNRFGGHELAAASGFERVALGYALRAALSQVQAEAHGVKVSHWVADEGWGAFDERNLLHGQQMLRRLAAQFERVFFVSHVGAIREVAETHLRVIPDAVHGSRLEVLS